MFYPNEKLNIWRTGYDSITLLLHLLDENVIATVLVGGWMKTGHHKVLITVNLCLLGYV